MCNEDKKFYVMNGRGNLTGPYHEAEARRIKGSWDARYKHDGPNRIVTIVATEVPEPPKVSRVVRNGSRGFEYRFCGTELQARINGTPWKKVDHDTWTVLSNYAANLADYAFVRDFAALCEEVLGGGK